MFLKLPNFHTYENGNNYNGSYNGMRFAIVINKNEDTKEFLADVWPEPWCREKTLLEFHKSKRFEFSKEGLTALYTWLENQYNKDVDGWQKAAKEPYMDALKRKAED